MIVKAICDRVFSLAGWGVVFWLFLFQVVCWLFVVTSLSAVVWLSVDEIDEIDEIDESCDRYIG